jgi:hypothetical protein
LQYVSGSAAFLHACTCAFIEEEVVIEKILRHCGLWKEPPIRPPPKAEDPTLDYGLLPLRSLM